MHRFFTSRILAILMLLSVALVIGMKEGATAPVDQQEKSKPTQVREKPTDIVEKNERNRLESKAYTT
ncbi:MAG: hypothetical protein ACREAC_24065, partial [Blastocatellia bacterium]